MNKLFIKRLLLLPCTFFLVLVLNFLLIQSNERQRERAHYESALCGPVLMDYPLSSSNQSLSLKSYLRQVARLDFGHPVGNPHTTVVQEVFKHLKVSAMLLLLPLLTTFILAQVLGLLMANYSKGVFDRVISALLILLYACPLYLAIPLMIEKIGIAHELPSYAASLPQSISQAKSLMVYFKGLFLPYLALTYGSLALYSRYCKTLYLQLLNEPYFLAAKSRGLSALRVNVIHLLRGGIVSLIPVFLGSLGHFFSGLVLVETLLEIKGFGYLFYQALIVRDLHLLLFSILTACALSIVGYFLADIALITLDPRMRKDGALSVYN